MKKAVNDLDQSKTLTQKTTYNLSSFSVGKDLKNNQIEKSVNDASDYLFDTID